MQKRTLFRQGACPSDSLELDQVYSIEEADILCKNGSVVKAKT
jgi:hypothetical protein